MAMYANIIIDISHEKLDKTFQYRIPTRSFDDNYRLWEVKYISADGTRQQSPS